MKISIEILSDNNQKILASKNNIDETSLFYNNKYNKGDTIKVTLDKDNAFIVVSIDEAIKTSIVYVPNKTFIYTIPFDSDRLNITDKAFLGDKHLIHVRKAYEHEVTNYRNLSFNALDYKNNNTFYPHVSANVYTRDESCFMCTNVVDGITANDFHGEYPYQSWGINMQQDAYCTIDFGRQVVINKIIIYLRADFPHDSWWQNITIDFSNNIIKSFDLQKTDAGQILEFENITTSQIKLEKLIKFEEESPFPALTQVCVFGYEK